MEFDMTQLNWGKEDGEMRCKKEIKGFDPKTEDLEQVISIIRETLQKEPAEWHPRAVRLFSEVLTVAWLSRAHFKEDQLKADEVSSFINILGKILNSFTHRM